LKSSLVFSSPLAKAARDRIIVDFSKRRAGSMEVFPRRMVWKDSCQKTCVVHECISFQIQNTNPGEGGGWIVVEEICH
jgi:hypothetical protein